MWIASKQKKTAGVFAIKTIPKDCISKYGLGRRFIIYENRKSAFLFRSLILVFFLLLFSNPCSITRFVSTGQKNTITYELVKANAWMEKRRERKRLCETVCGKYQNYVMLSIGFPCCWGCAPSISLNRV